VRLGAAGRGLRCLRDAEVEDLVLAGPIRRPSLADLRPDARGLKFFARAGGKAMGDDTLLRSVIRMLEEDEGFRVVGVDDILADIMAPRGTLGKHAPDVMAESDIARGVEVVRALGLVDVGQAAVVQDGIVLGVEAVEGTEALLQRCALLRRDGPGGVLVKLSKPGQEQRADLPTIGIDTVKQARAAGLRGIAIEAEHTLVIARDRTVEESDAAGLFLVGLSVS